VQDFSSQNLLGVVVSERMQLLSEWQAVTRPAQYMRVTNEPSSVADAGTP
jgi:hypothetical protein